ncbi:hypothetical protein A1O7_03142 [Cladophialophora yegresii CBS 114405]|uniref:Methyltransferase domain-containing protein n=1 Tax=Cladophialophora yegresii CBS 114405 TaxID=1182544 RepID=W9WWN0_9EURO|nr:uncharacterized protein A1O7_03142 [Cladophialophora yegresii CBS 114405]EXJ62704.1 hypothetical protein A1O7_03142 [Cladophialophora yegresii CBS 114405]
MQRLNAESLFDSVGPAYEHAFAECTPQRASLEWLLAHLPARECSVLDIGCGTGRPVCSTLASAGHTVTGIDVSGVMVEAATRNVPAASFVKIDVRDFEPPCAATYDAITVYFSLIASVSRENIRSYIRRIFDWLAEGGLFVFATVPISGEGLEIAWMGRPIVASGLCEDEVLERMKEVGFEVIKVERSTYMPRAVEAGICNDEDVWEEEHLFVYARKGRTISKNS